MGACTLESNPPTQTQTKRERSHRLMDRDDHSEGGPLRDGDLSRILGHRVQRDMPSQANTAGTHDYGIGGCSQEIAVTGAVVRSALEALGLDSDVYKIRLREPADLDKLVRSMRRGKLAAVSLSGPLCLEALRLADIASEGAQRSGCADTLMATGGGVFADNALFKAFSTWLNEAVPRRATAVVMGSGARACSVVAACRHLEFPVIGVTSRSWTSTETLHESDSADRIRQLGGLPTLWPGTDLSETSSHFSREMRLQFSELARSAALIVQTVAVDPSTGDARRLARTVPWRDARQDAVVCDLVYGPAPGPYLVEAERYGLERVGGVEMLTRRAVRLIETWTGQRPPRARLSAEALRVCVRTRA